MTAILVWLVLTFILVKTGKRSWVDIEPMFEWERKWSVRRMIKKTRNGKENEPEDIKKQQEVNGADN